jgi:hypothetical protein
MGAWDAGTFQNDTALDWVGDLCQGGDVATVRTTLSRVMEKRRTVRPSLIGRLLGRISAGPYLETRVACEGLAAAELVAFWLGRPDPHFPGKLVEWARGHSDALSPEVIALARQAVSVIKTKSELKDLWEEGEGVVAPKWHNAIADLERRLA